MVSGIVYVIRNGLQWKDAPAGCGPSKTLYGTPAAAWVKKPLGEVASWL